MMFAISIALGASIVRAIPMNCVNFEGGLRLTVKANPHGQAAQECLLDTGSSTLAFCDASLEGGLQALKTDYLSCNLYGSGNEGYWGFFYKGAIGVGSDLSIDSSYYSVMHREVSMPCGRGLQGIFGVAFKQLDQAAYHPSALNWPSGSVGNCPQPSKDFVGPLMSYLKQDTPQGRLGIYWNGAVGTSTGELYVGPAAETNSHYRSGAVQTATLGETGYYDVTINQFSFGGQSHSVSCSSSAFGSPCLVDTGTPIMFVPSSVYSAISGGQTGPLTLELAGPSGAITLSFDAETLAKNQYIAPYQGGPYILGLPLWAFYYTVFNVDGKAMSFVEHSASELQALKNLTESQIVQHSASDMQALRNSTMSQHEIVV